MVLEGPKLIIYLQLEGTTLQQPSPPPSPFGIPTHNCPKEKAIPRADFIWAPLRLRLTVG
jgi:hypothetical protein